MIIMAFLPAKNIFLAAQDDSAGDVAASQTLTEEVEAGPISITSTLSEDDLLRQFKTNRFLDRIKAEIVSGENDLLDVNRQIDETETRINDAEERIDTLKAQLDNLETKIKRAENFITNVGNQIAKKESEITTLQYQIDQKKVEISFQKEALEEYLNVLFRDQNDLSMQDQIEGNYDSLKLLLSDQSASEKLRTIRYSEVLEEQWR